MSSRIAILGAGGAGIASAIAFSLKGFNVTVYSRSESRVDLLTKRGQFQGDLGEGSIEKIKVTNNVETAMTNASLIFVIVPAYAQTSMARDVGRYLKKEQLLIFSPGSCGSLEASPLLQE